MTDEFWTDEQIYKAARDEWTGVLLQLWSAYGKQPDPKQFKVYVKQLSGVPLAVLEDVIATLLREHKFNSVPTLGEIWDVIKKSTGNSDTVQVQTAPWLFRFVGENEPLEVV